VVCYRTFASVDITGLFDKELVDELPGSLKFVCHVGKSVACNFHLSMFMPHRVFFLASGSVQLQFP